MLFIIFNIGTERFASAASLPEIVQPVQALSPRVNTVSEGMQAQSARGFAS